MNRDENKKLNIKDPDDVRLDIALETVKKFLISKKAKATTKK